MGQKSLSHKPEDSGKGQYGLEFWFKFLMGFGAALYLILLIFVMLVNLRDAYAIIILYYEIILIAYFILLSIIISVQGEKFRLLYAFLSLIDIMSSILLFGFNAAFINYPTANPWGWSLGNAGVLFLAYPLNLLVVLILIGTVGVIFVRIRPAKADSTGA